MQNSNPALKSMILEAVETQIREESPPEVKRTFARLTTKGMSAKKAKELIAVILVYEMNTVLASQKEFNEARYEAALQKLPKVMDEKEYVAS